MAGRFWREAATLIIVGRSACPKGQVNVLQEADYNMLFLKRSQNSSFMPSAFVFPGGVCEKSDFSLDWLDVFKKCGYTMDDLLKQFRNEAPLPPFYANKSSNMLLPEVGFRITAIRETFEECGLLLATHLANDTYNQINLHEWSKTIHKDASQFLSLFREFGGCPAIWDLHEWSDWLTPSDFPKRFDTAFFITFMDEISSVITDRKEIVDLQVSSPPQILKQWLSGSLWLPPPQVYEMCRFLQFELYDKLQEFAISRGSEGLARWCPVRIRANDGYISVLPGDDLYPKNSDDTENVDKTQFDSSVEELRNGAKCLHRMEFKSMQDIHLCINITPKFGHVLPLNFKTLYENSKL